MGLSLNAGSKPRLHFQRAPSGHQGVVEAFSEFVRGCAFDAQPGAVAIDRFLRSIEPAIGPVEIARAKIRDRGAAGDGERIRFSSAILPLWARRTRSLDALLPVLYLRGISTGDFQEALTALLGKDAPNLSPAVISRLTAEWQGEYERWQNRDLSARRYVYVWADGVFLQARMEDHGECMLVLLGATAGRRLRD